MDDELKTKIGVVAGKLVQEVMTMGLSWDEAVAAFGLAAKAIAQAAASAGDGTSAECVALARDRFEEAFAQDVRVVVADAGSESRMTDAGDKTRLATARRRRAAKLH